MVFDVMSLLNGERSVVILFVASVVFYLPSSLFYHGLALSILSLFAFFIEIRSELPNSLSQFKTRPGVPSGILLGAVTLPTVMLSKLIQVSRAFSSQEVGMEELESWTVQYWVSSISCLSLLLLLQILISRSENPRRPQYGYIPEAKFGVAFLVFCAALCCLSLSTFSSSSFQMALLLFWILFHGLAAVKLIQHILITFPACASIGEALLLTAGLILYFGDMLKCTIFKINGIFTTLNLSFVHYGNNRSEISTIIQGMLLGLLLFPLVFKLLLLVWKFNTRTTITESRKYQEICISLIFFSVLGFILIALNHLGGLFIFLSYTFGASSSVAFFGAIDAIIISLYKQFTYDPNKIISFVFSEPFKNISLCLYWVCLIYASVLRFYNISKNSKVERILLRKYYHLMAVLMFLPAVLFQPKFLHLSFGMALAVFLALEIIRVWKIWPLGLPLHQFMNAFTDHRDSDILIVSHFSLLLGCALPMWMSLGYTDRPLAPFAGILSLGIGDTMASVVGHKYGVLRWSKTGKKTIEGTAAGITSVLAACSFLLPLLASTGYIFTEHWFSLLLAIAISGLLEAYTAQLDNVFIPLVFYSLLCL